MSEAASPWNVRILCNICRGCGIYMRMRWFAILLTAVWFGVGAVAPAQAQTTTRVSVVMPVESVKAGDTVTLGVRFQMKSMWHVYWQNPGLGLPVEIKWTLPKGVTNGETQWPVPEKLEAEGLTSYVYHDEVVLLAPMQIAAGTAAGPLTLKAHVTWLECAIDGQCIPGQGDFQATLNIGTETKPSSNAALIDTWRKRLPMLNDGVVAKATWEGAPKGDSRMLLLEWTPKGQAPKADFYPFKDDKFGVEGKTEKISSDGGSIRLKKEIKKSEGNWPAKISGLLVEQVGPAPVAHQVDLQIGYSAGGGGGGGQSAGIGQFLIQLGAAILGGLILNVMPCVLPVIALKIFGFVKQSKEEPARVRKMGLIYGIGVLVSFLVLAGLVIAAKALGQAVSWGMQFQNPQFVVGMTVLVTLLALNLFGVFEVMLGGRAMGVAGDLASKEGYAGAFFNGVLATVLATPCAAPFLAGALGFAFVQPPWVIVAFFLMIGVGLAAPYVALSWHPAWLKFLPKPGVWMEQFKIAMGFPVLAVAVWLFTLASSNFGDNGDLWLGVFLVVLALVAWTWGQFVQRGRTRRGLAMGVSCAMFVVAYAYVLEGKLHWRHPVAMTTHASLAAAPAGIDWQPWNAENLQAARASGRPVLVDFTAKWCLTCQLNTKPTLESESVRKKMTEVNAIALLENSYTKGPEVVAELNRYERAGIPLVLVYSGDPNVQPEVLPNLITPSIVVGALDRAAKQSKPSVALK